MTTDAPLIAYNNLLATSTIAVRRGALDTGSGLDTLYDSDLLRPTFFQSVLAGMSLVTTVDAAWASARIGYGMSFGKWYWEIVFSGAGGVGLVAGVGTDAASLASFPGGEAVSWGYNTGGNKYTNNVPAAYGATFTYGDIIGVALDMDAGTLTFYKNGVSQGVAFSGLTSTLYPMLAANKTANTHTLRALPDELTYCPAGYAPLGELPTYTAHANLTATESRVLELGIYPPSAIDCVILGAARNDTAGALTGAAGVTISAWSAASGYGQGGYGQGGYGGYSQSSSLALSLAATNTSRIAKFGAGAALIVLKFTGCGAKVAVPELFVGASLEMPFLDYGFDPYNEVGNVSLFQAESGREYARLRYRRVEMDPAWQLVPQASWAAVDAFREMSIESRAPFWFAWKPDTAPTEVYLMRNVDAAAPFPINLPTYRSFSLKLKEVL